MKPLLFTLHWRDSFLEKFCWSNQGQKDTIIGRKERKILFRKFLPCFCALASKNLAKMPLFRIFARFGRGKFRLAGSANESASKAVVSVWKFWDISLSVLLNCLLIELRIGTFAKARLKFSNCPWTEVAIVNNSYCLTNC